MLNWEEVPEMRKDGITIGSHSHTHPILSQMSSEKAKDEILNLRRLLKKMSILKLDIFPSRMVGKKTFPKN